MSEIIKQLAENLDSKIKLKGIGEALDYVVIYAALRIGLTTLEEKHPEVAVEFMHLAEAYLTADKSDMIDEAADLLAEIVKKVYKVSK